MISTDTIFNIKNNAEFEALALDIFRFQFENNGVYRSFCDLLYKHPSDIKSLTEIPFLPIQFFKTHDVLSSRAKAEKIFTSSGTTGSTTSKTVTAYRNNGSIRKVFYKSRVFRKACSEIADHRCAFVR